MKKHEGFTLIELLVVIIVLGILAAYAIPKYMNIDKQARIAVVQSLKGSIVSASEMVHAVAVASNAVEGTTVNVGSGNVTLVAKTGYPDASESGIGAAIADLSGFSVYSGTTSGWAENASSVVLRKDGATDSANCSVTYTVPKYTPAVVNTDKVVTTPAFVTLPSVTVLTSGC